MKKSSILKKKEARFFRKLNEDFGSITAENFDTYPVGNPYKKHSKVDLKEMSEAIKMFRVRNPLSEERKLKVREMVDKYRREDEAAAYLEQKKKVRRLFFK